MMLSMRVEGFMVDDVVHAREGFMLDDDVHASGGLHA